MPYHLAMSPYREQEQLFLAPALICGAGDGARTRYLHLGKVALYQMSYARIDPQLMLWIIPYGCAARYKRTDDAGGNRTGCKFPVHSLHMSVHDWVTNKLVPPVGIEPTTRGFSVRCSTN